MHQTLDQRLARYSGAVTITYTWRGDFDNAELNELRPFHFDACGFTPTNAGLIALERSP
jgi:hypothetical protein